MFVRNAITSIEVGFVAASARAVAGVFVRAQHLPLPLHLLPYPGSGSAGLALNMDVKVT